MQEEVNYMLVGVFELLVARQQEYEAYAGYLEAVQDYWVARAVLTQAVGRRLPSSDQPAAATLDPAELTRPKDERAGQSGHAMPGMDHSQNGAPGHSGHGMHHAAPAPAGQEPPHVH